jgi:hypothetical protein
MRKSICGVLFLFIALMSYSQSHVKEKLAPDTSKLKLIGMNPAKVDPSELTLDRVDQLHETGTPRRLRTFPLGAYRLRERAWLGKSHSAMPIC